MFLEPTRQAVIDIKVAQVAIIEKNDDRVLNTANPLPAVPPDGGIEGTSYWARKRSNVMSDEAEHLLVIENRFLAALGMTTVDAFRSC